MTYLRVSFAETAEAEHRHTALPVANPSEVEVSENNGLTLKVTCGEGATVRELRDLWIDAMWTPCGGHYR